MKILVPTNALELLQFIEESSEELLIEKDFDWNLNNPDIGIFYDLLTLIDFLEWKNIKDIVTFEIDYGKGYRGKTLPMKVLGDGRLRFYPWEDSGEVSISLEDLKNGLKTSCYLRWEIGKEDPIRVKEEINITIRELANNKYKNSERITYSPCIAVLHFISQFLPDRELIKNKEELRQEIRMGSSFFEDLKYQQLKYKIDKEEDWIFFTKLPPKDSGIFVKNKLPIRAVPWRDGPNDFGIWIKQSKVYSDTKGILPPGKPLLNPCMDNPGLEDFEWYNLNGTYSLLFYKPDLHFVYIFSHYGTLTTRGIGNKAVNVTYDQRICYNPKKEFPLPEIKDKGTPPFHNWRGDNPQFAVEQAMWHQHLTSEDIKEMSEDRKKVVERFKDFLRWCPF